MKHLIVFSLILLSFTSIKAQVVAPSWNAANVKIYGGENSEFFQKVIQTKDKGFLIGGLVNGYKTNSGQVMGHHDTLGGSSIWIVHTDSLGTFQWAKTIGGIGDEQLYAIAETDSFYVIGGSQNSVGGDFTPISYSSTQAFVMWLSKTDGSIMRVKGYHGPTSGELFAMQALPDGKLLVGGAQAGRPQPHSTDREYWIAVLRRDGSVEWEKFYGSNDAERVSGLAFGIGEESKTEYYITGLTFSNTNTGDITDVKGGGDVWAMKLNENGNIIWKKCFGSTGSENSYDIVLTNKSKLVFSNVARSGGGDVVGWHGMEDIWVFQTDLNGSLIWSKCLGGSSDERPSALLATDDGGVLVGGHTKSTDGDVTQNKGVYDFWLIRLDDMGNIRWQQTVGTSLFDASPAVALTCSNGYVMVGGVSYRNNDFLNVPRLDAGYISDGFLVQLQDQGLNNKQCNRPANGIATKNLNNEAVIYPQPATNLLHITLPAVFQEPTTIRLSDATGKLQRSATYAAGQRELQLSTADFPAGLYLLSIRNGAFTSNYKVMVK